MRGFPICVCFQNPRIRSWSSRSWAARIQNGSSLLSVTKPDVTDADGAFDATPRRSPQIVTNDNGHPFTSSGFRASFRAAQMRAGITGLTFHDIRGSTVTRLAEIGCTEVEIASITGHSSSDVRSILDSPNLSRTKTLGDNAIRKLERRTKPRS